MSISVDAGAAGKAETPDEWAIVELMGHRQRAGRVSEVEKFGAKLLRIDIPAGDEAEVTEFYGGSAIYALRPTSEAVAREAAARLGDPRPVRPADFRASTAAQISHYDDDDEERPF